MKENEELKKLLAERMAAVMADRKMSVGELSEKSRISVTKLERYLKGEGKMMTGELIQIMNALNVSSNYLLGYSDYPLPIPRTEEEAEIFARIGKMSKEELSEFCDMLLQRSQEKE